MATVGLHSHAAAVAVMAAGSQPGGCGQYWPQPSTAAGGCDEVLVTRTQAFAEILHVIPADEQITGTFM